MCSDEDAAPHAVRYLNAQLAVLHENAKDCLKTHPQARSEENRPSIALAEFTVQRPTVKSNIPSHKDSLFHVCFKQPVLSFICDHDALLHLTVEKGFVAPDKQGKSVQVIPIDHDLRITYRVGFETRRIVGNDTKVGDGGSVIELVILDLKNATVSSIEPEPANGRDSRLLRYLNQYLDLLHSAGNHVLFSLPQFGQNTPAMEIAYSLTATPTQDEWLPSIYGVTVERINAHMSSLWLKAAMSAYGSITSNTTDPSLCCLAEFEHKYEGDFFRIFRIKFGAPSVSVLCSREVVIQFDIEELKFFADVDFTADPVREYTKWKVAMVVNVLQQRGIDDNVVRIMFDLSNGRYHHTLSAYPGLKDGDDDDDEFGYCDLIISFFTHHYLGILHEAGYNVLYEHNARWENIKKQKFELPEDVEGSWWSLEAPDRGGVSSRETIQRAKMHGFDQVIAISQESINIQFSAQLANSSAVLLHSWTYREFFSCHFKALSLSLLSNNRAIIWVHLTRGNLKPLTSDWKPCAEAIAHEFKDWRIAFEVELQMCSYEELEGSTSAASQKTFAYRKHGKNADRELRHIYLDLRHAEYIHEYSTYSDLVPDTEDSHGTILKLQAVIWYLTQHYFPLLCGEGLNVISSIPVWKTAGLSLPSYALTSAAFHVYSRVEVTRNNWAHVAPGQEPVIVVLGTTGYRALPAARLEWSTGWVVRANRTFSHGTLSIARRVFLEERLLTLLAGVNAQTTLIPLMHDPLLGFRGVSLRMWVDHEQRKDLLLRWQLQPTEGDGCLRYMWQHREEWGHKTEGNGDLVNVTQGMSCITRNYVELPTAVKKGALHIRVSGKVELTLSLQETDSKSFSATSSVSWSTNVTVQTTVAGIKVTTLGSRDPVFVKADFPNGGAEQFRNPMDMLREVFPQKVVLDGLVQEISAFTGAWEYCCPPAAPYSLASPVFNDDGDLLFELRRHDTSGAGRGGRGGRGGAHVNRSPSPANGGRRPSPISPRTRLGMHNPHSPQSPPAAPTRVPTPNGEPPNTGKATEPEQAADGSDPAS